MMIDRNKTKIDFTIRSEEGLVIASKEGGTPSLLHLTDYTYCPGDRIVISTSIWPVFLKVQIDEKVSEAVIYLDSNSMEFPIPIGKDLEAYEPGAFQGGIHKICVEVLEESPYLNNSIISCNPIDKRGETTYYPHAYGNVETRGESVFAARNVIDGIIETSSHGEWPYQSWGDNENPYAEITVHFGREIYANRIDFYLRADFPHDNYWEKINIVFSNGSNLDVQLNKTGKCQRILFTESKIRWVKMTKLQKSQEESPFPALTQMVVWGRDIIEILQ